MVQSTKLALAMCLLFVSVAAGCGATLTPRTSQPLNWQKWSKAGAMVDASRAHPVAFWVDSAATPAAVEVAGDTFNARQWLLHLSLRLNEAVKKKTLYDGRFASAGPTLFQWALRNGRYAYEHVGTSASNRELVERSGARTAELRLLTVKRERRGAQFPRSPSGSTASKLTFESEVESDAHWDAACVNELGAKILASARFWQAVATM